jgi:cysteinyl-tRNA synthetase
LGRGVGPGRELAGIDAVLVPRFDNAEGGTHDTTVLAPYVELILELRTAARNRRDDATGDLVRNRLARAGVEVRDTPSGPEWHPA